jgi:oxygen-independent coproporphyrinogen III oxidase
MAGLYIHVPFCKQVCYYCDFHFSASMRDKGRMVKALCREVEDRKAYTEASKLKTLYLGGGTPSVLSQEELSKLFETIDRVLGIQQMDEVTMEVNPDDLDKTYLEFLKKWGVNRLSIGIQSFSDQVLASMNRRHNAKQAIESVKMVQEAGFTNITIDLIYGYPGSPKGRWDKDLELAMSLDVPHISAYHLSIEDKTVFGRYLKKGKIAPVDESISEREYARLLEVTRQHGYLHYEISNFARPGYEAQHNSSYWKQEPYLGIGPSAHSYDGKSRQWNH